MDGLSASSTVSGRSAERAGSETRRGTAVVAGSPMLISSSARNFAFGGSLPRDSCSFSIFSASDLSSLRFTWDFSVVGTVSPIIITLLPLSPWCGDSPFLSELLLPFTLLLLILLIVLRLLRGVEERLCTGFVARASFGDWLAAARRAFLCSSRGDEEPRARGLFCKL